MQVKIKSFDVNMEVKSNGIEFEVRTPDGTAQKGDCYLSKTGLIWCSGKTTKPKGVKMPWDDFTAIMESKQTRDAAINAARSA